MDFQLAIPWLIRAEGMIPHIYLDTRGYMTVGVGYMIGKPASPHAKAYLLPWRSRSTGALEKDPDTISKEFKRFAGLPFGDKIGAASFAKIATIELDEKTVKTLLQDDINGFVAELRRKFPLYDTYPEPAQLALLDMAYNLGSAGFFKSFPTLVTAVLAPTPDWATAAKECHRRGPSAERNEHVRDWFLAAAGLPPGPHTVKHAPKKRSGLPPPRPKNVQVPILGGLPAIQIPGVSPSRDRMA